MAAKNYQLANRAMKVIPRHLQVAALIADFILIVYECAALLGTISNLARHWLLTL
jgi:hypothetical protein